MFGIGTTWSKGEWLDAVTDDIQSEKAECDNVKVVIVFNSTSSEKCVGDLLSQIVSFQNGSAAIKVQADLRQPESPSKIVQAARLAFGDAVDILVNNAAYLAMGPLGEATVEEFSSHFDLNVRAVVLMAKAVLPFLRGSGRIINISSMGSRIGYPGSGLYNASKAALDGLTRSYAAELGHLGHTVNCVNPGPVKTDMMLNVEQQAVDALTRITPMENRAGTPDDIAQIVAFLAEERSRWITGQTISATGGLLML